MISCGSRASVHFLWLFLLSLLLGACGGGGGGGSDDDSSPPASLQRVEISPAATTLAAGTTQSLVLTAIYADGSTETVTSLATWTSAAPATASVGNAAATKGLLRGNAAGTAVVTATFQGLNDTLDVTVTAATPSSLFITPASPVIGEGATRQLVATVQFSDGTTQTVTSSTAWDSSEPDIATVSDSGLVTGIDPGSAVVTATYLTLTRTATVSVTAAFPTAIEVTPTNPTVPLGGHVEFHATRIYSDGRTEDVTQTATWSSSAPSRATVSNEDGSEGEAVAVSPGLVNIRASLGGLIGISTMNVTAAAITSIDVTEKDAELPVGFERSYVATATFTDGTTRDVTEEVSWTSSDPEVATIDNAAGEKGRATGVAAGETTITAQNGSIEGSTALEVTSATLAEIGVTPADPSVPLGLDQQLSATGVFSDDTTLDVTTQVTWDTSDVEIASVSNADGTRGLAETVAEGSVTVTATRGAIVGQTTLTVAAAALTEIEITPSPASVAKGLTLEFTATGLFSDQVTRDITDEVLWSSSDEDVAVVSNDAIEGNQGEATGVGIGSAVITATLGDITATQTLNVTAQVLQSIAVTPLDPSVPLGALQAFTATGTYSDGSTAVITPFVTWASEDPTVATISNVVGSKGLSQARAEGTSTITATLGALSGSSVMTVTPLALVSITITPANATAPDGTTRQLTATGAYSNGTLRNLTNEVTWSSTDTEIAVVSNEDDSRGLATAVAEGSVTITATDPDSAVSGETEFTVAGARLTGIRVTPADDSLPRGFARQYTATGLYSDGSEQDLTDSVTWSTLSAQVAIVGNAPTNRGIVVGVAAGTTSVRASAANDVGTIVTGQSGLTVTTATLSSISVTPANVALFGGSTQQYQAVGTFSDGTQLPLTEQVFWSSSATSIATISNEVGSQGLATVVPGLLPLPTTIIATRDSINGTATLTRRLL